uniref:DUF5675 family protein n=1 Tax=Bernardetia sp. Wsw4-3y2 TaxID=3127471 RepID=UPI00403F0BB4
MIKLHRIQQTPKTTLGQISIEGIKKTWWTLEDTLRITKIKKETAIPTGVYEILLRKAGRIHQNYLAKFGAKFHKGTLHLQNVPNFQWILLHIGNNKTHTEGCPLIGNRKDKAPNGDFVLWNSTDAYKEFYPIVATALEEGKRVFIEITNDSDLVYFD